VLEYNCGRYFEGSSQPNWQTCYSGNSICSKPRSCEVILDYPSLYYSNRKVPFRQVYRRQDLNERLPDRLITANYFVREGYKGSKQFEWRVLFNQDLLSELPVKRMSFIIEEGV